MWEAREPGDNRGREAEGGGREGGSDGWRVPSYVHFHGWIQRTGEWVGGICVHHPMCHRRVCVCLSLPAAQWLVGWSVGPCVQVCLPQGSAIARTHLHTYTHTCRFGRQVHATAGQYERQATGRQVTWTSCVSLCVLIGSSHTPSHPSPCRQTWTRPSFSLVSCSHLHVGRFYFSDEWNEMACLCLSCLCVFVCYAVPMSFLGV